jgi:hypothetical protein
MGKLTPQQKEEGKRQRKFTRERVSRSTWLTNNDKRFLNAILDGRHIRHDTVCGPNCEPGWAKIPKKQLKEMTNLGQEKLNETIDRLEKRGVVKVKSDGLHAGRDGATRYRIINLPTYDPAPLLDDEMSQDEVGSTAAPLAGSAADKKLAHNELPLLSQPAKPQSEEE